MATYTWDKPLTVEEGETASLTTTASYLALKPGFDGVIMYSASAWRRALSPALIHVLYYKASSGVFTSYRTEATDRLATTHVPLDGMATDDYLYLGFSAPVLGIYIDMGSNVNVNAATLDVEYCSVAVPGALTFTDVSGDSDGTASAGATLAVDGVYTWTLPTDWVRSTLGTSAAPLYTKCYWIRFNPSATLSVTVDLNEIIPVYKNASYGYHEAATSYINQLDPTRNGGFVLLGTGTQTLNVTWLRHG